MPVRKKNNGCKKSRVLCRSIIGWCVHIKVAYLEFFPELQQIFSAPELQVQNTVRRRKYREYRRYCAARTTSTLIGLTMQTDTGIVVTSYRHCGQQRPPAAQLQKLLPRQFSRTRQGRAITRYASFVAFNKAYSTDINKRVHCVRAGPRHTRDDCKLGG